MKQLQTLAFCITVALLAGSCRDRSEGLEVFLHPDLDEYGPFSHVCKMSDGKRYVAVLGTFGGTVFVDYTDNKLEEGDIKFFPGAPSQWRECRTYRHPTNGNVYAYVVTEGDFRKMKIVDGKPDFSGYPGGIQIFKMTDNAVELVSTYIGNFHTAHTIFIDTDKGLAFVNGSRWRIKILEEHKDHTDHLGGLRILDIATDPENPRDLGGYSASYTHDSYALGEIVIPSRWEIDPNKEPDSIHGRFIRIPEKKAYILYLADILEGYIRVLDVTDPAKPVLVHSLHAPLHNQGISVHNIWASEDKKWLFATEETEGSSLLVYNISDPVKPRFVSVYRNERVADNSIIHNVVIKGNTAYCSWYKEGVRLIDISNPVHPKEIAFFDSSLKDFSKDPIPFHGNWSVDIDDRGLIMISDIEEGLFILRRTR